MADGYKYVSLSVWCPGHTKKEYIAFPELLADDEIRSRCSTMVNSFIQEHARTYAEQKDAPGWEDFMLHSGCKVSFVSKHIWESCNGHIW
mgnify:FL=1